MYVNLKFRIAYHTAYWSHCKCRQI